MSRSKLNDTSDNELTPLHFSDDELTIFLAQESPQNLSFPSNLSYFPSFKVILNKLNIN